MTRRALLTLTLGAALVAAASSTSAYALPGAATYQITGTVARDAGNTCMQGRLDAILVLPGAPARGNFNICWASNPDTGLRAGRGTLRVAWTNHTSTTASGPASLVGTAFTFSGLTVRGTFASGGANAAAIVGVQAVNGGADFLYRH